MVYLSAQPGGNRAKREVLSDREMEGIERISPPPHVPYTEDENYASIERLSKVIKGLRF